MPIGLLTDIAKSFSISEAKAGMLITVYSWIVMLLSLPLMLLVSKIDYKKLFMGTVALFGICQVLTVLSNSYGMLMASRIGVACAHAIFWSIASPIAVRMASEEHQSKALSMVVTGTSVATIAGLPLGKWLDIMQDGESPFDRGNHHIRCFGIYGIPVPEDGVWRAVPCEAAARAF